MVLDKFYEISSPNSSNKIQFHISQTADNDLVSIENGVVITSDSEIIDNSNSSILARIIHKSKKGQISGECFKKFTHHECFFNQAMFFWKIFG